MFNLAFPVNNDIRLWYNFKQPSTEVLQITEVIDYETPEVSTEGIKYPEQL